MQFLLVLEKIDAYILNHLFQRVADWWQGLTGKNNFWLARVFLWAYIAGMLWNCITIADPLMLILSGAITAYASFAILRLIKRTEEQERRADEGSMASKLNPYSLFFPFGMFRLVMSLAPVLIIPAYATRWIFRGEPVWSSIGVVVITAAIPIGMYFLSCTPKSPPPLKADNREALPHGA